VAALLVILALPALSHVEISAVAGPVGVYHLQDGRTLWLAPLVDESGPTLQFALSDDFEGRAKPGGPETFRAAAPCQAEIAFTDEASKLLWKDCHGSVTGKRLAGYAAQKLNFVASDGKPIGAVFWSAPGQGRPAVVLAHGADDETRQMGVIIPILLYAGLNVMAFDQRGSGESGGDWRSDGVVQIAKDVAQAARLLVADHLATRVGFYGFSNGGWVAPAAAARFGDPAFVIIKSGDSETVAQNVIYETAASVRAKFGDAASVDAARAMSVVLDALRGDTPMLWDKARRALQGVAGKPWISATQLPPVQALPLAPEVAAGFRRQLLYDPTGDLRSLRCPVLVLLGADDRDVNATASAIGYRRDFEVSGNRRATVVVYPGAGHQIVLGPGPAADDTSVSGYFAPGYLQAISSRIYANALGQH
jgi:alpha-beta hydrolase superfamily lysophospholipase